MRSSQVFGFLMIFVAVLIAVLNPLGTLLTGMPAGWGDLLNGGATLLLLLIGAGAIIIGAMRSRSRKS